MPVGEEIGIRGRTGETGYQKECLLGLTRMDRRSSIRYNRRRRDPRFIPVDFKVGTALGVILSEKRIAKKSRNNRSLVASHLRLANVLNKVIFN